MSEKQRPDSSTRFWMSMAVNQCRFPKMSCQNMDLAAACFSCVCWFLCYDSPSTNIQKTSLLARIFWWEAKSCKIITELSLWREKPPPDNLIIEDAMAPQLSVPKAGTHIARLARCTVTSGLFTALFWHISRKHIFFRCAVFLNPYIEKYH